MQLLPDEEILVSSNQDTVVLTNQRVHHADKEWGRSHQITIFLENISSIEMLYKSNPIFLVVAIFCFLLGFYAMQQTQTNGGNLPTISFVVGVVLLAFWFYSRTRQVSISSNGGGKLNFRVDGMKADAVEEFVDKVIHAKAKRAGYLLNV